MPPIPEKKALANKSTSGKTRKFVLVVDDEPSIANTLGAILRHEGFTVAVAHNAADALQHCNGTCPDAVISDVVMPGMDGIAMAIHIRRQYPSCKILLFSGMAASSDLLQEARRQGYDFELLSKPIHPRELIRRLED